MRIPVEPVRELLLQLGTEYSDLEIQRQTGLSPRNLYQIRNHSTFVRSGTYELLLQLDRRRHGYLNAIGTRRRVEALHCLGYDAATISRHAGVSEDTVRRIRRKNRNVVRADVARKIEQTYEKLSMAILPHGHSASMARNRARRCGYAPPLAWDDIDDPDERPKVTYDNVRHERERLERRRRRLERQEAA